MPGARIAKQYCPFDGKYTASYNGYEKVSCNSFDSLAHACPSGSTLNIHLKNCTTKSLGMFVVFCYFFLKNNLKVYLSIVYNP